MAQALKLDPDLRCDRCGGLGAFDFGERQVCAECFSALESSPLELGGDDLWEREERLPV